jgi:hypothetical protein
MTSAIALVVVFGLLAGLLLKATLVFLDEGSHAVARATAIAASLCLVLVLDRPGRRRPRARLV